MQPLISTLGCAINKGVGVQATPPSDGSIIPTIPAVAGGDGVDVEGKLSQ